MQLEAAQGLMARSRDGADQRESGAVGYAAAGEVKQREGLRRRDGLSDGLHAGVGESIARDPHVREAAAAADSRQERPVGIPEAAASAAAPRAATAARGKRSRPCICSAGS